MIREDPWVAHHEAEPVPVGLGPDGRRLIGEARLEAAGPAAVADVEGPAGLVFGVAGPGDAVRPQPGPGSSRSRCT